MEFFSNRSVIYTKWCSQTFSPIFGLFAIFDRNFANIVVPSSDENENCVALVKGLSLLKKCWKPHQNWSINRNAMIVWTMHHVERTTCRIGVWQKKTNTIFSHLQPVRVVRSPQTLHSGRARHAHPKRFQPFFDPVHSFSVGGKMLIFGYWVKTNTCQQMKECDIFRGDQNILWPLLHIFKTPNPQDLCPC